MHSGKQVLRGRGLCSAQSSLDLKKKIIKLHLSLAYTYPPSTPNFPTTPIFVFFSLHENNINLNNTALSQAVFQQALLGGTLRGQESVLQDKHPGPNFIICGTRFVFSAMWVMVTERAWYQITWNLCWEQPGIWTNALPSHWWFRLDYSPAFPVWL